MLQRQITRFLLLLPEKCPKITEEYKIRPRVTASILDTFSCFVQGIIPYGAQILILTGYSKNTISYPELLKNSFYLFLLLIAVFIYIYVGNIKEDKVDEENLNIAKINIDSYQRNIFFLTLRC